MGDQGPLDIVALAQRNDAFRAGTRHSFVNTSQVPLRLVTVYAPPEHPPGTVHQTKEEAAAAERGS